MMEHAGTHWEPTTLALRQKAQNSCIEKRKSPKKCVSIFGFFSIIKGGLGQEGRN